MPLEQLPALYRVVERTVLGLMARCHPPVPQSLVLEPSLVHRWSVLHLLGADVIDI